MKTFDNYISTQQKKSIEKLHLVGQILKMGELKVKEFFNDKYDPYLYVLSNADTQFEGIRVYPIENVIAFRVQNMEDTQPYGKAVEINVEEMLEDNISSNQDGNNLGEEIAQNIIEQIKNFFNKNSMQNFVGNAKINVMVPPASTKDNFKGVGY